MARKKSHTRSVEGSQVLDLRCLIEGEIDHFLVPDIPKTAQISILKGRIHESGKRVLGEVDAKDLILFKVRNVPAYPISTMSELCSIRSRSIFKIVMKTFYDP
jgi:hypothetical protein